MVTQGACSWQIGLQRKLPPAVPIPLAFSDQNGGASHASRPLTYTNVQGYQEIGCLAHHRCLDWQ